MPKQQPDELRTAEPKQQLTLITAADDLAYLTSFVTPLATDQLTPRAVFDMFESSIGGRSPPFNEIMRKFEPGGVGYELSLTFTAWLKSRSAHNAFNRFFNPVYLAYKLHYDPALKRAKLSPGGDAEHQATAHEFADRSFRNDWLASTSCTKGLQAYALTLRPKRGKYALSGKYIKKAGN